MKSFASHNLRLFILLIKLTAVPLLSLQSAIIEDKETKAHAYKTVSCG